jgi:hypothetical protein
MEACRQANISHLGNDDAADTSHAEVPRREPLKLPHYQQHHLTSVSPSRHFTAPEFCFGE